MRRTPVIIAVSVLASALIAAASLPWWLGLALGAAGGRYGVTFDGYRRTGYGRFVLEGLRAKTGDFELTASRIEAPSPLFWFARESREIVVDDWSVALTGNTSPTERVHETGWVILRGQLS